MTSTHIDPSAPVVTAPAGSSVDPVASPIVVDSPADSSFSDAYKEEGDGKEKGQFVAANLDDVSDDYAMTFDTDGEEHSDSQDLSKENIQHLSDLPDRALTINTFSSGSDANPIPSHPIPSNMGVVEATATNFEPTASQTGTEPTNLSANTYDDITSGEIDIQQLLDNITANAEKEAGPAINTPTSANPLNASIPKAGSSLPPHASLPPRPQVPSSNYDDDMSKYHAASTNFPQPQNTYKPGVNVPLVAAGAPGTFSDPRNGLPPPPSASFRQPPPSTNSPISPGAYPQVARFGGTDRPNRSEPSEDMGDSDIRWPLEIQKKFDQFLTEERGYVTDGQWDKFPVGSRLFIGNLPSDKVTKRDIFHVFHKYGRLAQIAIKQAYGFVQFHDAAACYEALAREQGTEVRGRKMHLEISKPQKNTRNTQASAQRRSRSPDYNRGGGRQGQSGRGQDRYDSRSSVPVRDEYGRISRGRDDYRPGRSPSPVPYSGRDEYVPPRGRDSYDRRDRRRSRSRSPYGQRDTRYRERPTSAGRREDEDAELQIPRRDPRNVPDVQIILMDQLDRAFVSWVEGELGSRGLKIDVMFLSSRLPLEVVIRRQILEGVLAISQLDMRAQSSSKIPLQVFDRQGGADNVRFDEYQDLDPRIAAELVLRAKAMLITQGQAPYSSGYGVVQAHQAPPAQPLAPNLANLVGQLDNATLQKLLGSLSAPLLPSAPVATASAGIDLAGLLGGLKSQPIQQPYSQAAAPDPYSNLANNPALSSLLGSGTSQQQVQQPEQSAQQVQNIMAQLARFRQ
ncbi:hypothetical protein OIDMADRAFT_41513 [Oidiodendron maius Zn]|uniref:RRM domain-containing protein n=1 Tax=Oidiodendron maius (strain Zn) TaxID=913774 RepID=A0A0C3DFQ5_OIDMZ|nr:hypothetical protein OIDMADRAFT_41513 [Oidiodendron maius Zn]